MRNRWTPQGNNTQRLQMFLDIVAAAVKHANAELDGLNSAKERMILKLKGARKNCRLADLVDLMIAKPLREQSRTDTVLAQSRSVLLRVSDAGAHERSQRPPGAGVRKPSGKEPA